MLVIWLIIMLLTFAPAKGAEIGVATSVGQPTCQQSMSDKHAAVFRLRQINQIIQGTKDPSVLMILREELEAVFKLHRRIEIWQNENCRES